MHYSKMFPDGNANVVGLTSNVDFDAKHQTPGTDVVTGGDEDKDEDEDWFYEQEDRDFIELQACSIGKRPSMTLGASFSIEPALASHVDFIFVV